MYSKYRKSDLRGGKTKFLIFFFFIGISTTKIWEKSRISRYGLPEDFLSKGQKTTEGGGRTAPPPPPRWIRRLIYVHCSPNIVFVLPLLGNLLYSTKCTSMVEVRMEFYWPSFLSIANTILVYPRDLYEMVTQNMLRTYEVIRYLLLEGIWLH